MGWGGTGTCKPKAQLAAPEWQSFRAFGSDLGVYQKEDKEEKRTKEEMPRFLVSGSQDS